MKLSIELVRAFGFNRSQVHFPTAPNPHPQKCTLLGISEPHPPETLLWDTLPHLLQHHSAHLLSRQKFLLNVGCRNLFLSGQLCCFTQHFHVYP